MPVVFLVGNVTTIAQGPESALHSLLGALSVQAKVGRASHQVLCLGKRVPQGVAFGTGLVPHLKEWASTTGHELFIEDKRFIPLSKAPPIATTWLRDYQQEVMSITEIDSRGIIAHPTGTGKGELIAGLIAQHRVNTLVIVPNESLLRQTADRIKSRLNLLPSIYGGGSHQLSEVTVATWQAIVASDRFPLASFEQVIFDEVHAAAADACRKILDKCTRAYYRYGLSASWNDRADNKSLYITALFGPVLHQISYNKAATDLKAIAKPEFHWLPYKHTSKNIAGLEWAEAYRQMIVRNSARNQVALAALKSAPLPCIVFVQSIEHADIIFSSLREQTTDPTRVALATGRTASTNGHVIAKTRLGEVDYLVSTDVFRQGVDIPAMASMMNLAGGKAAISVIQKVGRASRRWNGSQEIKSTFPVYDMADMGCSCNGAAHLDCSTLMRHFLLRQTHYGKLRAK